MTNRPKVSVLVPIYNVEKYLPECLDSLTRQSLKDLEIICINDGSTDSSSEIIKKYSKKDPRIVVITKKNSGYGDSMNQGLKKAKGKYIGILESDDFLDPEAFETMYNLAERYKADVVRANYYHFLGGKDTKQSIIDPSSLGRLIDPREELYMIYRPPAIWSGLYNREFLKRNHIEFLPTPGASYQDTGFNFKVWATARRSAFTDRAFLHYRLDNESSSVNNPGKVFCVCDEYAEIENYLKKHNLWKEFNGPMQIAKLGAYLWNIDRLSPKLAKKFIKRMGAEYNSADLDRSFFTDKQWQMLDLIKNYPPSVYYSLYRFRSARANFHKTLKKAFHAKT